MKPVERHNFRDEDALAPQLKRLQDSVIRAVNPIAAVPLLDGVLLTVTLGTSFAPVNHMLGRQYASWMPAGLQADARVWEDPTWNQQTSSISLRASAAVTLKIWVF